MADLFKEFKFDEIISNSEDRRFKSFGTVEVYDRHGELIPITEFKNALDDWMDEGGIILDNHTNKPIGKALRWTETTKNGLPAIEIVGKIFHSRVADKVWKEMKEGKREGLSVGGSFEVSEETSEGTILRGLEINEFSVVSRTGNQGATLEAISMAKSEDLSKNIEDKQTTTDTPETNDSFDELTEKVNNLESLLTEVMDKISGTPDNSSEVSSEEEQMVEEKDNKNIEVEQVESVEKTESKEEVKIEESQVEKSEEKTDRLESIEKSLKELSEVVKSLSEQNVELKKSLEIKKESETVSQVVEGVAPLQKGDNIEKMSYSEVMKKIESKEISPSEGLNMLRGN